MNDKIRIIYADGPTFSRNGFQIVETIRPPQNEDPRGPFTRGRGPIGWKLRRIRWRRNQR